MFLRVSHVSCGVVQLIVLQDLGEMQTLNHDDDHDDHHLSVSETSSSSSNSSSSSSCCSMHDASAPNDTRSNARLLFMGLIFLVRSMAVDAGVIMMLMVEEVVVLVMVEEVVVLVMLF
jgi:hypothetical protein